MAADCPQAALPAWSCGFREKGVRGTGDVVPESVPGDMWSVVGPSHGAEAHAESHMYGEKEGSHLPGGGACSCGGRAREPGLAR